MKPARLVPWVGLLAGFSSLTEPAWAVSLELSPPAPTLHGTPTPFVAELLDASAETTLRWDFGDGTETEFLPGATSVEHEYAQPGHYSVTVLADDGGSFASASFVHTVYASPTEHPARTTTSLLLDSDRQLVIAANQDNGSVTLVDLLSSEKLDEIQVFDDPVAIAFAPDGKLWVLHRATYAVGIVDLELRKMVDFFRLPYQSRPVGLVFGPEGNAYVTLSALGDVVSIDAETHAIRLQRHISPFAHGITVSGDGSSLWVTRFISSGDHGEVYRLDATTLEVVAQSDLMLDTVSEDTDHSGRGLPNYLFALSVTPDGKKAWIPSKKDNMVRGLERDGLALTQDNAVRPLVSVLDLETDQELFDEHIDLDDRNLPRHVQFTAEGDWALVSVYGSNLVELRDAFDRSFVTALRSERLMGPVATVLDERNRLFALAELSRTLVVFDIGDLLTGVDRATRVVAEVSLVEHERLDPEVLRGKQVFANAEDKRMASEGYLSCDSCHFEGFEDGQVWDFFDRGEGFRNTSSMLGRRGTGHGRLHWSGNFDEVQDFDNPIRAHQAGLGFITEEKWNMGTVSEPLGDPKAGLDEDLDALAAYVTSLDVVLPSPFRNPDGTLTAEAEAGREIFLAKGCDDCHGGEDFTNSAEGQLYDVGTMTELSGSRLGGELLGIDTPTLLGIWQTAPYLHDGSAATLHDVLTTRNPNDQHGVTSDLSELELDQLVAYLLQIDNELPVVELALPDAENPPASGGSGSGGSAESGGSSAVDASGGSGAAAGGGAASGGGAGGGASGEVPSGGADPGSDPGSAATPQRGCSFGASSPQSSRAGFGLALLGLLAFAVRRRRAALEKAPRSRRGRALRDSVFSAAAVVCATTGCGVGDEPDDGDRSPQSGGQANGGSGGTADGSGGLQAPGTGGAPPQTGGAGNATSGGAAQSGAGGMLGTGSSSGTGGGSGGNDSEGSGGSPTGGASGSGGAPAVCPETYTNPLIWEDLPDVEVIRVEDTYYYTASSFHQSPGAPVLRSYDLVHWEYVSHSVPVLDFDSSYDLDGGRAYVNGIWASTLGYRPSNQTFYWMGCMHNVGGGWVFTAPSPEGPWEKHQGGCYYDMGLLIDDDDKMYVAYGNNDISVAELSADGFSQVANQRVLTDTTSIAGGPLEGSRFIKRGQYYYILLTQYANGEWVTRSTNPMGPYETPREFAVRLPYAGATGSGGQPHQGGLVDTQNGDWYYIGFNDSFPAGRIPVMIPVRWNDDWPEVELINGQFGGSYPFPDLPCGSGRIQPKNPIDTFSEPELSPHFEWNHNPDDSKWTTGDGLTLQTATVTTDLYSARNTLTRRIEGPLRIATVELDLAGMQDGDVTGLAALRDQSAWIGVKKAGGALRVVMTDDVNMNTSWETTSTGTEVAGADLSGTKVWLRIEADVRTTNGGGTAKFAYSTDGAQFQALGNTLTMNRDWMFFLGYRFAIFNYATQSLGGSVKVLSFETEAPAP